MKSYIEFFEKAQEEFLNSLKQAQELNVKALESFTTMLTKAPAFDVKDFSKMTVPTPSEFVERTFAFTNDVLEARKDYMTKLAELATESQKQFADAAKRMSEAAKN
ncbi:MAG: hypothetical protein JO322_15040 [Candidatus Eremiobacteraeota bacterium]|nr:hypothetical protein [Candidatus Eremiobacteraeota bacterium]